MLQTHVNNDIYNKYCLIHNSYLDTTYVFSGEVETLSCYRSDAMIMKFLSEQFVLKLCQMDNLCQS